MSSLLAPSSPLLAQSTSFDRSRAIIANPTPYAPFVVTSSEPLRQALREGKVTEATALLVMDRPAGHLGLSVEQMTYHHAAQGEMAGEPWMVSF